MDAYFVPPLLVIAAILVGVGFAMGYVGDDPYQQLSILLSLIAIGLTIGIFVFQMEQNKRTDNLIFQIKERDKTIDDRFDRRKKYVERLLIIDLAHLREPVQKLGLELVDQIKTGIYDYGKIQSGWELLSDRPVQRIDSIMGNADVLDPQVLPQLQLLKEELQRDFSTFIDPHSASIQMGGILQIILNLLGGPLNIEREEMVKEEREQIESQSSEDVKKYRTEQLSKFIL